MDSISAGARGGITSSGKGVSGAGLTASVVKDEFLKGWSLEAGALVLANKGVCMIDEFSNHCRMVLLEKRDKNIENNIDLERNEEAGIH